MTTNLRSATEQEARAKFIKELKARVAMIEPNNLLFMSINMIPCHLLGSARSPFLGTGTH
jgi:hypothetical protein